MPKDKDKKDKDKKDMPFDLTLTERWDRHVRSSVPVGTTIVSVRIVTRTPLVLDFDTAPQLSEAQKNAIKASFDLIPPADDRMEQNLGNVAIKYLAAAIKVLTCPAIRNIITSAPPGDRPPAWASNLVLEASDKIDAARS